MRLRTANRHRRRIERRERERRRRLAIEASISVGLIGAMLALAEDDLSTKDPAAAGRRNG